MLGAGAAGHPVLAICGDGGLTMALGELATLVRERVPVTVLVVDDGGYGMLRHDQRRAGDRASGGDLVTPDFVAFAAAFGLPATAVDSVAELRNPLSAAVRTGARTRPRARPADPAPDDVPALARGPRVAHPGQRRRRARTSRNGGTVTPPAAILRRARRRATSTPVSANVQTTYCTVQASRNASGV